MTRQPLVWITGANRGIGAALARHFIDGGSDVALFVRSTGGYEGSPLPDTYDGGNRVSVFSADLTDRAAVDSAIAEALNERGAPDILINNAGMNVRGTLEPTVAAFEAMIQVNLVAPFLFCQRVVPGMKQRGSGMIVNMGSVCSKTGFAGGGAYCATKFALLGFTESLFHELTPLGIKVTALCPSWVNTDMASYAPHDGSQMIQPGDIVNTIEYLRALSPFACPKEVVIENTVDAD